jgi:hypothetical protein
MMQDNTSQQGSDTHAKKQTLGSTIDPNVILPASQNKSTLRSVLQQVEGQNQNKKVAPVMVRSYSKDVQSAMERGKNMKDAKHLKMSLDEEKRNTPKPSEQHDVVQTKAEQEPIASVPKKDHVPIPTKDLAGAPKKTLTFATGASVSQRPKMDIPKAPLPPYKNSVSTKDQSPVSDKKEKESIHTEDHKDGKESSSTSPNPSHKKDVGKTNDNVVTVPQKVDRTKADEEKKRVATEQHSNGVSKDVQKTATVENPKKDISIPIPPKKKDDIPFNVKNPETTSALAIVAPKKEEKAEIALSVPKKEVPKDTKAIPPVPKPAQHNSVDSHIDTTQGEKRDVQPAQEVDPFDSVLFGGDAVPVVPKKEVVEKPLPPLPTKPSATLPKEDAVDHKNKVAGVIESKQEEKKQIAVPVGMEQKQQKDTPVLEHKLEQKKEAVPETKPAQKVEPPKILQTKPPEPHVQSQKSPESMASKQDLAEPSQVQHRIEYHVSSEQLRAYKNDVSRIDQDIVLLEAQQKSAAARKDRLLSEKKDFEQKLVEARQVLDEVIEKEDVFERTIHDLEKEELSIVDPKKRHAVEEKRWSQEDLRAEVEKEKWNVQDLYAKVQKAIEEKNNELDRAESSCAEFARRITQLTKERSEKKFKIKLGEVEEKKQEIENIQVALLEEKRRLERLHTSLEEDEKKLVAQRKKAEDDEKKTESFSDKRSFEELRRSAERSQREIEQKRWETEESLEKVIEKIQRSNEHYNTVSKIEDEIRQKLSPNL